MSLEDLDELQLYAVKVSDTDEGFSVIKASQGWQGGAIDPLDPSLLALSAYNVDEAVTKAIEILAPRYPSPSDKLSRFIQDKYRYSGDPRRECAILPLGTYTTIEKISDEEAIELAKKFGTVKVAIDTHREGDYQVIDDVGIYIKASYKIFTSDKEELAKIKRKVKYRQTSRSYVGLANTFTWRATWDIVNRMESKLYARGCTFTIRSLGRKVDKAAGNLLPCLAVLSAIEKRSQEEILGEVFRTRLKSFIDIHEFDIRRYVKAARKFYKRKTKLRQAAAILGWYGRPSRLKNMKEEED